MASFMVEGFDELIAKFDILEDITEEMASRIVMAGAQPIADAVRTNLNALPEDKFRQLKPGEKFTGVPRVQKRDLQDSLGIARPDTSKKGIVNTKVGFSGYGSKPTTAYPKGLPNALLARSIESGATVRIKIPFIRKAIIKARPKAIMAMKATFAEVVNNILSEKGR